MVFGLEPRGLQSQLCKQGTKANQSGSMLTHAAGHLIYLPN
jgi:hypothetical protein